MDELNKSKFPVYQPSPKDQKAVREVMKTYEKGRSTLSKGYNYFQQNNLYEVIDDWTKRWNGYIPPMNPLLDQTQSQMFVNFTRNAIISYLSKVALTPAKSHIISVNKKTGMVDQKFADLLEDLNTYSLNQENGDAKFLQAALECVVKGTVVVYEGYKRTVQKVKSPLEFDATTGKLTWKKEERVLFDNCFQEVVPLEDFYITNPFEADVQKQPKVIWRKITSYSEAKSEFKRYKDFKYVIPGQYTVANDVLTFYRNALVTQLEKDQVEILRYYCRYENRHIILVNGIVLYDGPIPFKDGKYPFAKAVNEPFANDFFWGNGHPNKYMGEQDLINSFINMMADKTFNSLAITGLTSDLDDVIEDDVMEIGKFRKVGDINNWKWWEAPGINNGELGMFQQVLSLARESANTDAGGFQNPRGGKLSATQMQLKQQELMSRLSFNMNFLEDLELDRTSLRVAHILQFYSIPKITRITGKTGKEVEKLVYRDIQLADTRLSDGRKGSKVIKLVDSDQIKTPDDRQKLADDLSVIEMQGEIKGQPTQALALSVDAFQDYHNSIQIVKNSSYEKNKAIDQASRMQFAQWRLSLAQIAPLNTKELIGWVEESFDIDTERFENAPVPAGMQMPQGMSPNLQGPQMNGMAPAAQAMQGNA